MQYEPDYEVHPETRYIFADQPGTNNAIARMIG